MYNIIWQQNSQAIEERLIHLKEILRNAPQRGNAVQGYISKRTHTVGPETTATKKDKAPKSRNRHVIKKPQIPPQSSEGERGNYAPPPDQENNRLLKVQKKHPLCTKFLKIKVPKYVEKPPKLGEYDGKEDTYEHM